MILMLVLLSTILSILFGYLRYKHTYWQLNGVEQLPTNFLYGTWFRLESANHQEWQHEIYTTFKRKAKLAGFYIFLKPVAVILDLDLVKTILIKEFNKFSDRTEYSNDNDPLNCHLFNVHTEKWRILRTKLTPTFTSGKMKFMFSTITEVADEFMKSFLVHLENTDDKILDIHDMCARYTTDVIGSCVFGVECGSLKDPDTAFRQMGKIFFYPHRRSIRWLLFKKAYGNYIKCFGVKNFPKELEDFFLNLLRDTVTYRKKENVQRNDFITLLMEIKNADNSDGLSIEEMAAQAFVFFAAGYESSSTTMALCLYELAKNHKIQDKVRADIQKVLAKHKNELTYETMVDMKYLGQCLTETLRKYPVLAFLARICNEDFQVPGTNIMIAKGTEVMIPVKAIHFDPDIYDNPTEFRPERFSPEEQQNRHPQSFLGFGDGPRNCIGLRFGRMQSHVGMINLLTSFKFSVCDKTPKEIKNPKSSMILVPESPVWINVEKI